MNALSLTVCLSLCHSKLCHAQNYQQLIPNMSLRNTRVDVFPATVDKIIVFMCSREDINTPARTKLLKMIMMMIITGKFNIRYKYPLTRPGLITSKWPTRQFWISCSRFTLSCKIPQTCPTCSHVVSTTQHIYTQGLGY